MKDRVPWTPYNLVFLNIAFIRYTKFKKYNLYFLSLKVNVFLSTRWRRIETVGVQRHSFLTSVSNGRVWSTLHPQLKIPVPTESEVGCVPEAIWGFKPLTIQPVDWSLLPAAVLFLTRFVFDLFKICMSSVGTFVYRNWENVVSLLGKCSVF